MTPKEASASMFCGAKLGSYTPALSNDNRVFSLGKVNTNCDKSEVTVRLMSGSKILAQRFVVSSKRDIRPVTPYVQWKGCKTVHTSVRWIGRDTDSPGWFSSTRLSKSSKICFS